MKSLGLLILVTLLLAGCATGTDPSVELKAAKEKLNSDVVRLEAQYLGVKECLRRSEAEKAQLQQQLTALQEENASLKKLRSASATPAPGEFVGVGLVPIPLAPPPTPPAAPPAKSSPNVVEDKKSIASISYKNQPRDEVWFERMYAEFRDKIAYVAGKYIDVGLARIQDQPVLDGNKPLQPLTREQFAEALLQIQLVERTLVPLPNCSSCGGKGQITVRKVIGEEVLNRGFLARRRQTIYGDVNEKCTACGGLGYRTQPGQISKGGKHYRVVSKPVP
jgi:outer membrane murein-binding lipoprotein Lpp